MSSGDRGGNRELINIIKSTKTPIICICNDRMKTSVRSLANSCFDLKMPPPTPQDIARRMTQVRDGGELHLSALCVTAFSFPRVAKTQRNRMITAAQKLQTPCNSTPAVLQSCHNVG